MKWCFDTSALIEPWVRHYPPDVFSPIWTRLAELAKSNVIAAPEDVRIDLEQQKDDLFKWSKALNGFFVASDKALLQCAADIVNDHPGLIKPKSTKSGSDPFVIAMAEVNKVPVVTYETRARKGEAPKIPNVCDDRGILTASLVDVLRAEGFKL